MLRGETEINLETRLAGKDWAEFIDKVAGRIKGNLKGSGSEASQIDANTFAMIAVNISTAAEMFEDQQVTLQEIASRADEALTGGDENLQKTRQPQVEKVLN